MVESMPLFSLGHHPSQVTALQSWVGSCSVQGSANVCVGFAVKPLSPRGRRRGGAGSVTSARAPVGLNSPDQPRLGPLPLRPVCRATPCSLSPSLRLRSGWSLQSSFTKLPSCCCCLARGSPSTWSFPHWCTTAPVDGFKRKTLRGRILLPLPCLRAWRTAASQGRHGKESWRRWWCWCAGKATPAPPVEKM